MANLWENDEPVSDLGIDVPQWIDGSWIHKITPCDVAAILQGGCSSGAWMPAVTYWQALETMNEYGDDIMEWIIGWYGSLPFSKELLNWSQLAVFYLSVAVEMWASSVEDEISDALDALADDDEQE